MGVDLSIRVIASVSIPTPGEIQDATLSGMVEVGPELVVAAQDGWPVRSGKSRDAWTDDALTVGGLPTMEIANRASNKNGPYPGFVRRNKSAPLAAAEALDRMVDTMDTTGLTTIIDSINRSLEG